MANTEGLDIDAFVESFTHNYINETAGMDSITALFECAPILNQGARGTKIDGLGYTNTELLLAIETLIEDSNLDGIRSILTEAYELGNSRFPTDYNLVGRMSEQARLFIKSNENKRVALSEFFRAMNKCKSFESFLYSITQCNTLEF